MGRKKKYYTKEEKLEAQRKLQMYHYERNKAKILKKAKERYRLKKLEERRKEKRRKIIYLNIKLLKHLNRFHKFQF